MCVCVCVCEAMYCVCVCVCVCVCEAMYCVCVCSEAGEAGYCYQGPWTPAADSHAPPIPTVSAEQDSPYQRLGESSQQ